MDRCALTLAATSLLLYCATADAQWDTVTGHIRPTPGVPIFDPAPWNAAFKVMYRNVPLNDPVQLGNPRYKTTPRTLASTPLQCSSTGFDTTPVYQVKLGDCFYKNNTAVVTFDAWFKVGGLATQDANCYCYALNHFEGDLCHPGSSNNGRVRYLMKRNITCPLLHTALTEDGAQRITRQQALTGQPDKGHYIAAMARPMGSCVPGHCAGADYHFLRKDASGTWSWKMPGMPASDKDVDGRLITDPDAAPLQGHYRLCGYYRVEPDKMPIGSDDPSPGPLAYMANVQRFMNTTAIGSATASATRITVTISPSLPYNATTDDGVDPGDQELQEDAAWERQRGTPKYEAWKLKELQAVGALPDIDAAEDSTATGSAAGSSDLQGKYRAKTGRTLKSLAL